MTERFPKLLIESEQRRDNCFAVPDQIRPSAARRRVLDATRALLQEHSFGKLTMEAVASRSGLTRRTVYNQFEDREALYRASRLELFQAFEDSLPTEIVPHRDIATTLERFCGAALAVLATPEHRELLASVKRDGPEIPWLKAFYSSHVDRPLRLAIENYLLKQAVSGTLEITEPAEHARRGLMMLCAAISVKDASPVFEAAELAALFLQRVQRDATDMSAARLFS